MQLPGPGTSPFRLKTRNADGDASAVFSCDAYVTPARWPFAPTRPTRLFDATAEAGTRMAEPSRPMAIQAPSGTARRRDMAKAPPSASDAGPRGPPESIVAPSPAVPLAPFLHGGRSVRPVVLARRRQRELRRDGNRQLRGRG